VNRNGEGPVLLPAKRFTVWSRLYNRFLLEPAPAVGSNAFISPIIQPITSADNLLKTARVRTTTQSVTGTGDKTFFTVPKGERWTVGFIRVSRNSGTMTYTNYLLQDAAGLSCQVEIFASEAETHLFEFSTPRLIDEGWDIQVFFDAHSVTGNVTMVIIYEEEAAF